MAKHILDVIYKVQNSWHFHKIKLTPLHKIIRLISTPKGYDVVTKVYTN